VTEQEEMKLRRKAMAMSKRATSSVKEARRPKIDHQDLRCWLSWGWG
jgi:hypothetical protein